MGKHFGTYGFLVKLKLLFDKSLHYRIYSAGILSSTGEKYLWAYEVYWL